MPPRWLAHGFAQPEACAVDSGATLVVSVPSVPIVRSRRLEVWARLFRGALDMELAPLAVLDIAAALEPCSDTWFTIVDGGQGEAVEAWPPVATVLHGPVDAGRLAHAIRDTIDEEILACLVAREDEELWPSERQRLVARLAAARIVPPALVHRSAATMLSAARREGLSGFKAQQLLAALGAGARTRLAGDICQSRFHRPAGRRWAVRDGTRFATLYSARC